MSEKSADAKTESGRWSFALEAVDLEAGAEKRAEFLVAEAARHQEVLAERKRKRELAKGEGALFIGPPDPRKLWKWRPTNPRQP